MRSSRLTRALRFGTKPQVAGVSEARFKLREPFFIVGAFVEVAESRCRIQLYNEEFWSLG